MKNKQVRPCQPDRSWRRGSATCVFANLAFERCVLIKSIPAAVAVACPGRTVLAVDVSRRPLIWFVRGSADPKINPTAQRPPFHAARHFTSPRRGESGEVTKSVAFADQSSLIELMQAYGDRRPPCRTRWPVMSAGAIDKASEAGIGLAISSALAFVRGDQFHQGHQLTLHGLVLDLAVGPQQSQAE